MGTLNTDVAAPTSGTPSEGGGSTPGAGLPAGGVANDVLVKSGTSPTALEWRSGVDFVQWALSQAAAAGTALRAVVNAGLTETGDAINGWSYTGSAGNWALYALLNGKAAAGTEAALWAVVGPAPAGTITSGMIGFTRRRESGPFSAYDFGLFPSTTGTQPYQVIADGVVQNADVNRSYAAGDLMRLRFGAGGATVYAEISSDQGQTWTAIKTWTGVAALDRYAIITTSNSTTPSASAGSVNNVRGSGLVISNDATPAQGAVVRSLWNYGLAESGSVGAGWTYTGTSGNWTQYLLTDAKIAAGTEGSVWADMLTAPASSLTSAMLGLKTSQANGHYLGYAFGVFVDPSLAVPAYRVTRNGSLSAPTFGRNWTAGDKMRLRVGRGGTAVYAEVSSDSGLTWHVLQVWTGLAASDYYAVMTTTSTASPSSNGALGNLRGSNIVTNADAAPAAGTVVRSMWNNGVTETGDPSGGWSYVGSSGAWLQYLLTNAKIASGVAGSVWGTVGAITTGVAAAPMLGLKTQQANGPYAGYAFGVYVDASAAPIYRVIRNGASAAADVVRAAAAGDMVRLRTAAGGATVYVDVSGDGGRSWATIKTWTAITPSDLFAVVSTSSAGGSNGALNNLRGSGVTINTDTAPVGTVVRVATNNGLVESGDGTAGWTYTGTAGNWTQYGLTDSKIASGSNGAYWGDTGTVIGGSATASMIGLKTTNTNGAFAGYAFGIYTNTTGTPNYQVIRNGVSSAPDTARTYAVGDKFRLRVADAGATVYAEVSSDGGVSYATIKTWSAVTPSDLFPTLSTSSTASPASNGSVGNLRGTNVVAA